MEFAVGTSPGDAVQVPGIRFSAQDGSIQVSYNWNPVATSTGITATIQSSVSLRPGSWKNVQPTSKSFTPGKTGSGNITLQLPPGEQSKRVFYRLQILAISKEELTP